MKPASRDAIIGELERLFMRAGSKDYDSAMAIIEKLLKWVQEAYHPMRSKANFAATLDSLPEPSWLEMRYILGVLKYIPQLARFIIKPLAEAAVQGLPPIPRGRPGLDLFTKEQIVAHVGKRHIAGYTLEQAKKAAARNFEVSEATVQRAWDDRGNRGAVDFRSVLKFLEEDAKGDGDLLDSPDSTNE